MTRHFDRNHADVIALQWTDVPAEGSDGFTVEGWFMLTDPLQPNQALWSYAAYAADYYDSNGGADGQGSLGEAYENDNELLLDLQAGKVGLTVKGTQVLCQTAQCSRASRVSGSWVHLAVSCNVTSGRYKFYVNGTDETASDSTEAIEPKFVEVELVPRGVAVFGQEQVSSGLGLGWDWGWGWGRVGLRLESGLGLELGLWDPRSCPKQSQAARTSAMPYRWRYRLC